MHVGNQKVNGVVFFVAGSLLGAGIALLLAPQSGRKTRRDILYLGKMVKNKSDQIQLEMGHAVDNFVEGLSEKVEDGIESGRDWTDKTTQGVLQALNTGKQYVQREIEKVMQVKA